MDKTLEAALDFLRSFGLRVLLAAFILFIGTFIIRFLKKRLPNSMLLRRMDKSTGNFLRNTILIALRALLIATVLITLGMPATSFVTILASAGVTIGLAVQGSLSNLAGGIMIMFFRPYNIGDTIKALNMEGTVKEISAFYTTIVTRDNSRVVLPNGTLNNSVIINYSAEKTRRIEINLKMSTPEPLEEKILEILKKHPKLLHELSEVLVTAATASDRTYRIHAWCAASDYEDILLTLENELRTALNA